MTKNKSLLPDGISDVLPPNAKNVESIGVSLLQNFSTYGYEMVIPPLLEFEENIASKKLKNNSFRVVDPYTNKMMAIRPDITMQISRIATHRLNKKNRPLRIMYSGNVLRVKSSANRTSRGFKQYGVELIGIDNANADAEVISLAIDSLQKISNGKISVDICIPKLPKMSAEFCGIKFSEISDLIEKRDMSEIKKIGGKVSGVFGCLLSAQGDAKKSIDKLQQLDLSEQCKSIIDRVSEVVNILQDKTTNANITIDACETKGFNFQTGIGFTLFSSDSMIELGRGGRYIIDESNEPSVGFSMYSDTLENIINDQTKDEKIFAPVGTDEETINKLRSSGKIVISALSQDDDAKKIGCEFTIKNNEIVKS